MPRQPAPPGKALMDGSGNGYPNAACDYVHLNPVPFMTPAGVGQAGHTPVPKGPVEVW